MDVIPDDAGPDRQRWPQRTHERAVEHFYSHGVERYGDYHGGYLNFGLWEDGVRHYEAAAENLVRRLAHWGALDEDSVLADVACGTGAQDVLLAREFRPRVIHAVDVTWGHVEAGRRRVARAGLEGQVHLHHGSATALPFAPACFTHVLGVEGPVHFDTRERFLQEAFRVLEPGGTLLLADYCAQRELRQGSRADRLVLKLICRGWHIPWENCDTQEDYVHKLQRTGFTAVQVQRVGALTYPGYFREQRTLRNLREMRARRGLGAAAGGLAIDVLAYEAYRRGYIDYVLVKAQKP
ncbi:methyltransferase domain-containing protein [Aggregicoccus sp. 17bor-14]|uniref:class I SAM-dependent methyltransferase n=1 Tax=Myxococcaceae TaxID=31 RepID=UPI00129CDC9E|nr:MULTISPECIES: class I SAM-dependent methyltransferase [Myxococcaceae]MBF5043383.1 methyltransferase domain-containing protein [Simulacricoccus sp. 17bor-14]MRI89141.1 methyltransferase domain-containing protein [Aggregicoccus sp. 17bor-14]